MEDQSVGSIPCCKEGHGTQQRWKTSHTARSLAVGAEGLGVAYPSSLGLALRSHASGARGRAPQARSAAQNQYDGPPHIGTFMQCAPKQHKIPPQIGTFIPVQSLGSVRRGVGHLVFGADGVASGVCPRLNQAIQVRQRAAAGDDIGDAIAERLDQGSALTGLRGRVQAQ